jgi:protein-disulfide isomerase
VSTEESTEGELTRKQRRDQARAERKAAEEAVAAGAARRRRMAQLGGAVAVVVVAIVVILIATSGGSSSTKVAKEVGKGKTNPATQKAVASVKTELEGIPQSGNVLGKPTAPVTLQYFGDLECPICRQFTLGALPKLIQTDVRTGKLKIEYRNLETATREPETFRNQQSAALAAGKQGKGWDYIELFYQLQGEEGSGYVDEKYLQGLAADTPGLDLAKWSADRADQSFQAKLAVDTQEANNDGFNGTPAFMIGKTGGAMKKFEYSSLTDPSGFEAEVAKLAKA